MKNVTLFGHLREEANGYESFQEIDPETVSESAYFGTLRGTTYMDGSFDQTTYNTTIVVSEEELSNLATNNGIILNLLS